MTSPLSSTPKDKVLSLEQSNGSPEEVKSIVAAHLILSRPLPQSKGVGSKNLSPLSKEDAEELAGDIAQWKQIVRDLM